MRHDIITAKETTRSQKCDAAKDAQRALVGVPTKERLAELGSRFAQIGHELRQPLFTIVMAGENLRQMLELGDVPRERMYQAIERIEEQVQRAHLIIQQTLDAAAGREAPAGVSDMALSSARAVRFLEELFDMEAIVVDLIGTEQPLWVPMTPIRVEQIFVNVLRNAVDAIRQRRCKGWAGDGRIVIAFEQDGGMLSCTIVDNGVGLVGGSAQTEFLPFVTTKRAQGNGLGLYIAHRSLRAVGGSIALVPGDHEGAQVDIRIPLVPQAPQAPPPAASDVVAR